MANEWYGPEVLITALHEIIDEADQSNGGKGARLPIVVHIREIADAALRQYGSPVDSGEIKAHCMGTEFPRRTKDAPRCKHGVWIADPCYECEKVGTEFPKREEK